MLRSLGLAQLMTQSGMFVGAERCSANVVRRRLHALQARGGRDDGERQARRGAAPDERDRRPDHAGLLVLLCNESFASTNEREGSEIARQVVRALLRRAASRSCSSRTCTSSRTASTRRRCDSRCFLRAERGADGARPFKLAEGEPLPTSYGEDCYRRVIFGAPTPRRCSPPRRAGLARTCTRPRLVRTGRPMSADRPSPRPPDPRQPRQPDRRGRRPARRRRVRPRRGAVGRVDRRRARRSSCATATSAFGGKGVTHAVAQRQRRDRRRRCAGRDAADQRGLDAR